MKNKQTKMKETIILIVSLAFTIWGAIHFFHGDITNGLLAMILGELIDMPIRNNLYNKKQIRKTKRSSN